MLKWWGDSLAWVEALEAWDCALEALVLISPNKVNDIMYLVSCTTPTSVAFTLTMPPNKDWDGLLVSTVRSAVGARLAVRIFNCWQPWIATLAFPPHFNRW